VDVTPESYDAIASRVDFERRAVPLIEFVHGLDNDFGSAWFDTDDTIVVPALATATDSQQESIRALVPPGGKLRFTPAKFSARTLLAWSNDLDTQWRAFTDAQRDKKDLPQENVFADLAAINAEVAALGPRDELNLVGVDLVSEVDQARLDLVWARAASKGYAPPRDAMSFTVTGAASPTDSRTDSPGQVKSGLSLNSKSCTSNLSVTDSSGVIYQLTAGHCYSVGSSVSHSGQTIGTVASSHLWDYTNNDAELIRLSPGGLGSPYAFAQFPSGVQADTISSYRSPSGIAVGNSTCMGGVSTEVIVCGSVTALHQTVYYSSLGVHIADTFRTSYPSIPGDSGALHGYGPEAFGINSGTGGGWAIVTPLGNALSSYGVTLMTTSPSVPADWAYIVSPYSNKCADVPWNNPANGTAIWSWSCQGNNPAQQWSLVPVATTGGFIVYEIKRFAASSKCLDVENSSGGLANGLTVQEWDCTGTNNQLWRLGRAGDGSSEFLVVSILSGKCLDLDISQPGGGFADGTRLQQWDCLFGQINQLWHLG